MLIHSPSLAEPFYLNTFTCHDQKTLAHSRMAGTTTFHTTLLRILKNRLDLSPEDFKKLNVVDYFMILLQVRTFFINDEIAAHLECECKASIEFNFSIGEALERIDDVFNKSHRTTINNIIFDIPPITDAPALSETDHRTWPAFFLASISGIDVSKMSGTERMTIYDNLPVNIFEEFEQVYSNFLQLEVPNFIHLKCAKCSKEVTESLKFVDMLRFISDMFFRFDFKNCVMEFAVLSKNLNLNPSYVSDISPMEKRQYLQHLEKMSEDATKEEPKHSINTEFGF